MTLSKAPQVLVVPAYNPGQEEDDILDQHLSAVHYAGVPVPPALADADYASIVSDGLFGADQAPRFIVLVGLHEWLLLDRFKWPNSRALRFDWSEILDRRTRAPCRPRRRCCTGTRWLRTVASVCWRAWTKTPTDTRLG